MAEKHGEPYTIHEINFHFSLLNAVYFLSNRSLDFARRDPDLRLIFQAIPLMKYQEQYFVSYFLNFGGINTYHKIYPNLEKVLKKKPTIHSRVLEVAVIKNLKAAGLQLLQESSLSEQCNQ